MAIVKNMWLKGVVGKVGDSTLYTSGGETILRDGSSNVKNPQTYAQMIQRVIAKTAMNQYSALQFIANHSFQGKATGAKCMERFLSRNMRYFRDRAIEVQNAGGTLYELIQFAAVGSTKYTPAAVILSEGKLPQVETGIAANGDTAYFMPHTSLPLTYADVINTFGLKRGDQLTFVTIDKNIVTGEYTPHYVRVILDPRNLDGSAAPLTSTFIGSGSQINCPNMRNRGSFVDFSPGSVRTEFKIVNGLVAAAGIIVSRKNKSAWMRSNCKLVLNENVLGSDMMSLGAAVDASLDSGTIYTDDDLFLNNAGSGGAQATESLEPLPSLTPSLNNDVEINGVSQNVLGGTVGVNTLSSVKVYGANIPDGYLTIAKDDETAQALTVGRNGTEASITLSSGGIIPNTDETYHVVAGDNPWFDIIVYGTIHGLE